MQIKDRKDCFRRVNHHSHLLAFLSPTTTKKGFSKNIKLLAVMDPRRGPSIGSFWRHVRSILCPLRIKQDYKASVKKKKIAEIILKYPIHTLEHTLYIHLSTRFISRSSNQNDFFKYLFFFSMGATI